MTDQELGAFVRHELIEGGLDVEALSQDETLMFLADFKHSLYKFGRDYPTALGALREMQRA